MVGTKVLTPRQAKVVMEGVLHKVVIPMITSPVIGFFGGWLIMGLLYALLGNARPRFVNRFFGKAQMVSAAYMGFAHGLADALKTMGVITLALVTATATGTFATMPDWLGFPRMDKSLQAEDSLKLVQNPATTPEQLQAVARVLEQESAGLKPGEFKEAFLTLAAKASAAGNDPESAKRTASGHGC